MTLRQGGGGGGGGGGWTHVNSWYCGWRQHGVGDTAARRYCSYAPSGGRRLGARSSCTTCSSAAMRSTRARRTPAVAWPAAGRGRAQRTVAVTRMQLSHALMVRAAPSAGRLGSYDPPRVPQLDLLCTDTTRQSPSPTDLCHGCTPAGGHSCCCSPPRHPLATLSRVHPAPSGIPQRPPPTTAAPSHPSLPQVHSRQRCDVQPCRTALRPLS
jgi:hypothetical protein